MPEVMQGQCRFDLLEDVIRARSARLDPTPSHAAAFQHQSRPHALVAGLWKRCVRRRVEHISVRRFPLWKKHNLQIRRDRDKAVGGLRLESTTDSSGTGKVDIPLDVYLIDSKVEISSLKPQHLAPADGQIAEGCQKLALRMISNRLQHALSFLWRQRPAPTPLGSPGPNQRNRGIVLEQPFRISRAKIAFSASMALLI